MPIPSASVYARPASTQWKCTHCIRPRLLTTRQGTVSLQYIRLTCNSPCCRWFYFRVTGARGEELNINITNAGEGSFPTAWPNYQACASYDRKYWFRVPSNYDKESGVLSWKHTPEHVRPPASGCLALPDTPACAVHAQHTLAPAGHVLGM